jgi:hypothetical protein
MKYFYRGVRSGVFFSRGNFAAELYPYRALELQSWGPVLTRNATTVGVVGYMVVLVSITLDLASYFCLVARSHPVNRWEVRLAVVRSGRVPGHTRPDSALYPRFRPEQGFLLFCPPQS